jgi:hypothetical protein
MSTLNNSTEYTKDFKFAIKPESKNDLSRGWRRVNIVTNFLRVNFNQTNRRVWEYAIIVDGKFNEDDQKKRVIKSILPKIQENFSPFKLSGYNFFSLTNREEDLNFKATLGEEEFDCVIKKTKHFIDLSNINPKNHDFNRDVKSFFEKVIKQIILSNKKMLRIKDNYYDLSRMGNMNEKSYLASGFSTGFRNTDCGFLLLVNIKNKFINGISCLEKLSEIRDNFPNGQEFQSEAQNYFRNLTIMTTYGSPRTYKLSGVDFQKNVSNTTIKMRNSCEEISLLRYYSMNYPDQKIQTKNQPLLVVEKKPLNNKEEVEMIYLIPELCHLTGMEDKSTELKSKMCNRTRIRPNDKMNQIGGFLKMIDSNDKKVKKVNGVVVKEMNSPNEIKENWGINFSGFKETSARIIPPPMVNFARKQGGPAGSRIQYKEIIDETSLEKGKWMIIVSQKNRSYAKQVVEKFQNCCKRMGIRVDEPSIEVFHSNEIAEEISRMNFNRNVQLLLIILDRRSEKSYKDIKNFINSKLGIPSQVVKCENLNKNLSYFSNVLNQMVIKMGKRLFTISFDPYLTRTPTVFIGLLIEKCGKTSRKIILTCSYDLSFCKYFTKESICKVEDLSTTIVSLLSNACDNFGKFWNRVIPSRFIIYRSGVSDAEKKNLFKEEINTIEKYLKNLKEDSTLIYTVVNKKHDFKFFEKENSLLKNPNDGTVVDRDVTSVGCYEFFLQNQFVNQGCATPTHYHVLYSTIDLPLETFQQLTFHMSYYYWNWPGPTRLPACLKFAETYSKNLGSVKENDFIDVKEGLRNSPFYV